MDPRAYTERTMEAVEAFNRGDMDAYLASYAPELIIHGLPAPLPPTLEGHRHVVETLRSAVPDVRVNVHEIVADGDIVALRTTFSGTHSGELQGIPATGRHVEWDGMMFLRYRDDGLTVERWMVGDTLSLLAQIQSA